MYGTVSEAGVKKLIYNPNTGDSGMKMPEEGKLWRLVHSETEEELLKNNINLNKLQVLLNIWIKPAPRVMPSVYLSKDEAKIFYAEQELYEETALSISVMEKGHGVDAEWFFTSSHGFNKPETLFSHKNWVPASNIQGISEFLVMKTLHGGKLINPFEVYNQHIEMMELHGVHFYDINSGDHTR